MSDVITRADYQSAALFDMRRFGLTLPEALSLVKDPRYPGILKTIEDWRAAHGWPPPNSDLARGYIYKLLACKEIVNNARS